MSDENTISGFSADADNLSDEVLEVTVYGTQAANIKKEVAVIKNEEYKFENDPLQQCNSDLIYRDNILNTPIVYTTKLDHMKAFDKIERHTTHEITEMILEESRPRYKQVPGFINPELADADITTYIKLNSQVHQMNDKVKIETFLRNEKLLKLCKPLKIVLKKSNIRIKIVSKTVRSDNEDVEERFTDTNSDDEPLALSVTSQVGKNEIVKVFRITFTIVLKDKQSQEVDLYIINSYSGVQSYYRTSKAECGLLHRLHLSMKLIYLEYCCWVDREKRVNRLVSQGCVISSAATYMRTPHNCLPRPCSCCCRFGCLPKKRYNEELNMLFKKKPMNKECITPVNNNNTIEKAFNYVPKVDDVIPVPSPMPTGAKPLNILKNAVIIIKYQQIIFAQSDILGENYEIGSKGDIINYVRPTINRSIVEEKQLYQKHDKPNEPRLYIPHLVCCWHRREEVIAHLTDYSYVLPSTLRFLRTPHICKVAKCQCCCKPVPMINFNLQHFETQYVAGIYKKQDNTDTHKEPKQKKGLQTPKLIYFNKLDSDIIEDEHVNELIDKTKSNGRSIGLQKRKNPNKTKTIRKSTKKSVGDVPQSRKQKYIDLTDDYCLPDPITPHRSQALSGLKTDLKLHPSVEPTANNNTNTAHLQTSPTTLTQNFLDNIKDFTLSVNKNGKLVAMINTQPEKMSDVDIKMISNVLSLASAQIEALGITPQEFCNRVNSSKSGNSLTSSLITELTPINLNIMRNTLKDTLHASAVNIPTPQCIEASTPNFKAVRVDNSVPKTTNLRSVCSIFQAMSSLAAKKNLHLVEAYRIYFRETISDDNTQSSTPILKRKTTQKSTKITKKKPRVIPASDQNIVDQSGIVKSHKPTYANKSTFTQTQIYEASPQFTNADVQAPHDIANISHSVPTQSLIDMCVPSLAPDTQKRIITAPQPRIVADSSMIPTPSAVKGAVPQTEIKTKTLIVSDSSSSDDEVLPIDSEDNGRILDSNDFTPQTVASVSESSRPVKPVPCKNPILFQILMKEGTNPRTAAHKKEPRSSNQQGSVTPLIPEHSNGKLKKRNRTVKEGKQTTMPLVQMVEKPVDLDEEFDFETSLKTNVISVADYPQNDRLEVVNNQELIDDHSSVDISKNDRLVVTIKQLIDDNGEAECIFGV